MFSSSKSKAFTIIELLVVIVIIAVLATLATIMLSNARTKARDARRLADMKQLQTALDIYYSDQGYYPSTLTPDTSLKSPDNLTTYMSQIPKNPVSADGSCPANTDYTYQTQNNNTSFTIVFCLGGANNSISAGTNTATPAGIITSTAQTSACSPNCFSNCDLLAGTCDNNCTIASGTVDLNTTSCSGRATADMINFSSTTNTSAGVNSLTLSTTPTGLAIGDEVLIINLQGTSSDYNNVGQYEFKKITNISSNTLSLNSTLTYGYDGTTQKIMVQRVPHYNTVTISSGATMTASAWDGTKNGILAFKATTVNNSGTINMNQKGFRGADKTISQSGAENYNGKINHGGSGPSGARGGGTSGAPAAGTGGTGTGKGGNGGAGGGNGGNIDYDSMGGGGHQGGNGGLANISSSTLTLISLGAGAGMGGGGAGGGGYGGGGSGAGGGAGGGGGRGGGGSCSQAGGAGGSAGTGTGVGAGGYGKCESSATIVYNGGGGGITGSTSNYVGGAGGGVSNYPAAGGGGSGAYNSTGGNGGSAGNTGSSGSDWDASCKGGAGGVGGQSGGTGGGVVLIYANTITNSGNINTNGGAGGGGGAGGDGGVTTATGFTVNGGGAGGGGGGAGGGAIYLRGSTINITNDINSTGGNGGSGGAGGAKGNIVGANGGNGTAGSTGTTGVVAIYYINTLSGTSYITPSPYSQQISTP